MATYCYRCPDHGCHDVSLPFGTAPAERGCPACAAPSRRVFSSPLLARLDARLVQALDHADRSREAPAVVSRPPRRPTAPARTQPASWAALPRL